MNKIFFLSLFLGFSATANNHFECKSIDVTFRPFYAVDISVFDETFPDYYVAKIVKTIDLEGKKKVPFVKEGKGKFTKAEFFVDFKGGGKISGKRLANGVLTGELRLNTEKAEELVCSDPEEAPSYYATTKAKFPACNSNRKDFLAYATDEKNFYYCNGTEWVKTEIAGPGPSYN